MTASSQPESSRSGRAKSAGNSVAAFQALPVVRVVVVPSDQVRRTTASTAPALTASFVPRTATTALSLLLVPERSVSKKREACQPFSTGSVAPTSAPSTQSAKESSAVIRISAFVADAPSGAACVSRNPRSWSGSSPSASQIQEAPAKVRSVTWSGRRSLPIQAAPAQSLSVYSPVRKLDVVVLVPWLVATSTRQV